MNWANFNFYIFFLKWKEANKIVDLETEHKEAWVVIEAKVEEEVEMIEDLAEAIEDLVIVLTQEVEILDFKVEGLEDQRFLKVFL